MPVQRAQPEELGRLMGLVARPSLLGPVFGPLVGGLLVDGASWRWIFYANVPTCVAAFVLSLRFLPANTRRPGGQHPPPGWRPGGTPLDVLGVALLSPGLALFAYGLSRAGDHGSFAAPEVLWPAGLGVVLPAAFAGHSLTTRREPILDLRLLRSRPFAASAGTLLVAGMLMFGDEPADAAVLPADPWFRRGARGAETTAGHGAGAGARGPAAGPDRVADAHGLRAGAVRGRSAGPG
jgi:hypothetical protein